MIPRLRLDVDLVLAARVPIPGMEARSGIRGIWGQANPWYSSRSCRLRGWTA